MYKRKNKNFLNNLGSVLRNFMVNGLPHIAKSASTPQKILRKLVFIICLIGFIYQSISFMNIYWKYETVLDIRVENPKTAEMPSITVCTNNGILTSELCADPKFSSDCFEAKDGLTENGNFCKCMQHICMDGVFKNVTIPNISLLTDLAYSEYKKYQPYLRPFAEIIRYCYYKFKEFATVEKGCNLGYYRNIRCLKEDDSNVLHACYTIHTLIDRPDGDEEQVQTRATEILTIDAGDWDFSLLAVDPEIKISIHNSRNILNPYICGHLVKKGHVTTFRLTKTVKRLLPPPYETNCKDYLTEWKIRGGRGPTTEKECVEECERNNSMKILGCVISMQQGPTNEKICKDNESEERVLLASQDCAAKNCKPACYEVSYEAVKDVVIEYAVGKCYNTWGSFSSHAKAVIKLDGMRTTTYTYSPKYQNIETFSYLGGYVGMWLGISLVAVFDFLETLVIILRYPFGQITHQRARRRRVFKIRRF